MSCLTPEQIYLYLERGTESVERRAIETHLNTCPSCRRAVEERAILHEASLNLPPLEVPPGFARTVLNKIPVMGASSRAWIAALVSGVGILLLVFMGATLLTGQSIPGFLASTGRTLGRLFSHSAAFLGKALEISLVGFRLVGEFFEGLMKILNILSSYLLRPETAIPALFLALLLTFLFVVGMKRILLSGEKT